ncbi:hypothetical protein [Acidicapsa ligni]|uniref:hypothetical protein n=1 Tax=Acidicapsa ligni TaxID=542300 RepID=UPI0021DFDC58|nr:hypothetical protein [Acidicapsa ligni]
MSIKSRAEFSKQDEWISYVHDCVPVADRAYALASGRTELFKSFYDVRRRTFPVEFATALERIHVLSEPERTIRLEQLNEQIFESLTGLLFDDAQSKRVGDQSITPASPKKQVEELLDHLIKKNPYFALWTTYKSSVAEESGARDWDEHLCQELGMTDGEEVEFTRAMADLDKVLRYFRDHNISLPRHFFERTWFLHYLRGPERMLQTRALLNTLTAEIRECTSE